MSLCYFCVVEECVVEEPSLGGSFWALGDIPYQQLVVCATAAGAALGRLYKK